jgi:hypothetical protein
MSSLEDEPIDTPEDVVDAQEQTTQRVKDLVDTIINAQDELVSIPREALLEAAWQGIAIYHVEQTIWGDEASVRKKERVKECRKSLLTPKELERAIHLANLWLDDNFSQ